jgi:hypothetical protein
MAIFFFFLLCFLEGTEVGTILILLLSVGAKKLSRVFILGPSGLAINVVEGSSPLLF